MDKMQVLGDLKQEVKLVSNLSRKIVKRSKHSECSSLGAALVAGLYMGVWKNQDEIIEMQNDCDMFTPNIISENVHQRQYLNWKKAVSCPIMNKVIFSRDYGIPRQPGTPSTPLRHGVSESIYEELGILSHSSRKPFPVLREFVEVVGG
ncbi:glycerol kinase 5 [Trichonephila clavipes]|uniref:Glycerol kinase 5 n=1 Tax=Trichonephila clavipes TaxID=2585209 RepID=A0A8X6VAL6_TRICX|nr:glycerol kinase 5 [Trichonephila clavipes]